MYLCCWLISCVCLRVRLPNYDQIAVGVVAVLAPPPPRPPPPAAHITPAAATGTNIMPAAAATTANATVQNSTGVYFAVARNVSSIGLLHTCALSCLCRAYFTGRSFKSAGLCSVEHQQ